MAGPQRPSRGTRGPPNRGALQIPQSGTRASPASPEIEDSLVCTRPSVCLSKQA